MRNRTLAAFALAAGLAAPAIARAQQDTTHKPVTPAQVGKNVEHESKRVANRTGKTVRKAGKDTEHQAKRTARSLKRATSRKARREAKGDTAVKQP